MELERAPHKAIAFVAVLLATLTLFSGCGNQEPSDTANESAPDAEVTAREQRQQQRHQLAN